MNTIEEAIEDIKAGKIIIIVDDEDRENEGDLYVPSEFATPENVNFMAKHGRGLICVPMERERLSKLNIFEMVKNNTDPKGTGFTASVDIATATTGISAFERSETILKLIDDNATSDDFTQPGHIFPLIAREGGVLIRAGHTEAAVDLAKMADLSPSGVICEIMNDDGTMARLPELEIFAKEHDLKIISIAELIEYRMQKETLIIREASCLLPTKYGEFKLIGYRNKINNEHHVALVLGNILEDESVLVRVHSECLTGDAFGSLRCDCGQQYDAAMKAIAEKKSGVLIYMRQEGRGIGLLNKIKAYNLQDLGHDTAEANLMLGFKIDERSYGIGAQILLDLGIKKIDLMTNNPKKLLGLSGFGIEILNRIPIQINHNEQNEYYLKTKKEKMGHLLK